MTRQTAMDAAARTTAELRGLWDRPCTGAYRTIPLGRHGASVTVDARCIAAFAKLGQICEAHGYRLRREATGGLDCRRITGGRGYSLHAYGIAVDLNRDCNPYGRHLVTDMPAAMVSDILAVRTLGGHQVFRWGGAARGHKDAMHYEIVASPAELAAGIRAAPPEPVAVPIEGPAARHWIGLGDKGEPVRSWQCQLNDVEGAGLAVDGGFGVQTLAATVAFQIASGLEPDGKAGPRTLDAMRALHRHIA